MVGEYANGRLLTPISQRQTEQPSDNKRFVARLAQNIRDNTGAIAIPSGTLLALRIISVDGASAASVEVTSIIKNETEYPLPPGTISVYGKNGTPLVAKQFKDKGGEIARYDTTVAVMGGLAKVGEIINQPEDEETIEDPFTGRTRSRRRNSRRNIGGAILEGAFGELTSSVKKRAETSTQEIMSRPNTWFIPAKTKLTFIVNRSIQLPNRL
ncbi:MAG: TrbI/VirB10 family protein [Cyanobacteria bacterium J06635_10]